MSIIHKSWGDLMPTKLEQSDSINGLNKYIERITKSFCSNNIPKDWLKFIFKFYNDKYISVCCSWINFETVKFTIVEWPYHDLMKISFISDQEKDFLDYINNITTWTEKEIRNSNFTHCSEHISYWENYGTWKEPPFIIKITPSSKDYLPISNRNSLFLLIEGYSRFGLLKRFTLRKNINLLEKHKVCLIM